MTISRLEPVSLRGLWANEAKDFTTWLSENLDILNEQLKLELKLMETEKGIGPFSADILTKDANGNMVIIENQLEETDHTHLGQILMYAVNLDVDTVLWISSDPRQEHIKVVSYLSDNTPIDFYLIKVQAFKIADSPPAPLFNIVAGPSEFGPIVKDLTAGDKKRHEFFRQLLEKSNKKMPLFTNISPSKGNWISAGSGKAGTNWGYSILRNQAKIEFVIYAPGPGDEKTKEKAKKWFNKLLDKKDEIEGKFGDSLEWDQKEGRRNCIIRYLINDAGLNDEDKWSDIQDKLVDVMYRLEKALQPHIKKL